MENNSLYNCNVDDLHNAQLDILRELHRVCKENNMRYYMCCGTCLGAIRHKGFIPWDSDIDVFMYYTDADRLPALQSEFSEAYFVQTYKTDPQFKATCIRIRKTDTTFIENETKDDDINHGVWIDVYPIYYFPDRRVSQIYNIYLAFLYRLFIANRIPENHGTMVKGITRVILSCVPKKIKKHIIKYTEKRIRSYKDTRFVYHYFSGSLRLSRANISKTKWFMESKTLEFEGEMFSGPTFPEAYLKKTYGDYMKLPPKEEQILKFNGAFIDTNNSYKIYKGKKYCVRRR